MTKNSSDSSRESDDKIKARVLYPAWVQAHLRKRDDWRPLDRSETCYLVIVFEVIARQLSNVNPKHPMMKTLNEISFLLRGTLTTDEVKYCNDMIEKGRILTTPN